MPVNTKHPSVSKAEPAWKLVRDVLGGPRTVRAAGEEILPSNHEQPLDDYAKMSKRAIFLGATKRALKAFTGFVFRNNPQFTAPSFMKPFMDDATMTGKTFYDYCKIVVKEVDAVGRCGSLIEWDDPAKENRAFVMHYKTEDIINWKYKRMNGKTVLALLVLREMSNEQYAKDDPGDDPYENEEVEQYRQYELLPGPENTAFVHVSIWRERVMGKGEKAASDFVMVDQSYPNRRGFPLERIPFVCHNVEGDDLPPGEIPLEDMAEVNCGHFRNSADHEKALHICGSPTLMLAGFDAEQDYYLGSDKAIVTEKSDAKGEYLQLSAESLAALEKAIDKKEEQMAALGARMLEKQSSGRGQAEAYETVAVRQSGETSALMDITIACTQTLSKVMAWVAWWSASRGDDVVEDHAKEAFVELNTDFVSTDMDPTMLTALTSAYMSGSISEEVYFHKLQQGGIIQSEKTFDEEQADKEASLNRLPVNPSAPAPDTQATLDAAAKMAKEKAKSDKAAQKGKKPPPAKKK